MPQCSVLKEPTLDPEVKDQIWKKNPQFGTEHCLYSLQEELLVSVTSKEVAALVEEEVDSLLQKGAVAVATP